MRKSWMCKELVSKGILERGTRAGEEVGMTRT